MKPRDRYTKFREKAPKKAGTYVYHINMRPPGTTDQVTDNFQEPANFLY